MAELIHSYLNEVSDPSGASEDFTVVAMGEERADGTWEGWLEFRGWAGDVRRTERETTQPSREALRYWASGLEHVYLEGALARAS